MMYLKFIKHPVIPADPREAFIIRYPPRNLHTRLRRLNEPSVLQHPRLLKAAVTCGHALLSLNIRGGGEGVVVVWGGGGGRSQELSLKYAAKFSVAWEGWMDIALTSQQMRLLRCDRTRLWS